MQSIRKFSTKREEGLRGNAPLDSDLDNLLTSPMNMDSGEEYSSKHRGDKMGKGKVVELHGKTQADTSLESKIEESKVDATSINLTPADYTLQLMASGLARHNEKYNTSPAKVVVIQNLLNHEGGRADSHVHLDVGSLLDDASKVRVSYVKAGKRAHISACYLLTPTPHWFIVGGVNDEGEDISAGDLTYLADGGKDKEGKLTHKAGDFIISKADCATMRFKIRDLMPHLISRLSDEFVNSSGDSASADLIAVRLEAERAKRLGYQRKAGALKKQNKPYEKFISLLAKCNKSIADLESKLTKLSTSQDEELTQEELDAIMLEAEKLTSESVTK